MIRKIFFYGFLLHSTFAAANEINWIVYDFPPYYIINEYGEGLGRDEGIIHLLQKKLPHHKFNYINFPGSRVIHELSDPKQNYCTLSLYKTPQRSKNMLFTTTSSTIGLPLSIAMRLTDIKTLNIKIDKPVSFSKLLNKYKLIIGLAPNRSYGNKIDSIIKKTDPQQVIYRPGMNVLAGLTHMLVRNRIDIVLGYPDEHEYIANKLGIKGKVISLQLEESPSYSEGYIGCSLNQQGQLNINLLELALQKIHKQNNYYQLLIRWLPKHFHQKLKNILESDT